jgi:hypothetical protein
MFGLNKSNKNGTFQCGDLTIRPTDRIKRILEGQTSNRIVCSGEQKIFEVSGGGVKLDLAYTSWENGERDIQTDFEVKGPAALRRLDVGRLRLPVQAVGGNGSLENMYVFLRQARVKVDTYNKWSNLFKADRWELDEGAGLDTVDIFKRAGAIHLGTKEKLLGAADRSRFFLCAIFNKENEIFPVVAFVVTRVLPLINEYPAPVRSSSSRKDSLIF